MNFRIVKTVADLELVKQRLGALVFPHFRRGPAIQLGRLMREQIASAQIALRRVSRSRSIGEKI